MSNFKKIMPQQDFAKLLADIKTPQLHTPEHRKRLKNALLQSADQKATMSKSQRQFFQRGSTIFVYFQNMPFKKIIPAGVLAVLILTIVGQNYLAMTNTAYAQDIINDAIEKVSQAPVNEDQQELLSTIQILEEAKKNGKLQYLGEGILPAGEGMPERKFQKLSFIDEDLAGEVYILFNPEAEPQKALEFSFPSEGASFTRMDIQNQQIINLAEVEQKLFYQNIQEDWIQKLIHQLNQKMIRKVREEFAQKSDIAKENKEILEKILALMEKSEVVILGYGYGGDGSKTSNASHQTIGNFYVDIYSITNQKIKKDQARKQLQVALEKLSHFNSEEAQMKKALLEKALQASDLTWLDHREVESVPQFFLISDGVTEVIYYPEPDALKDLQWFGFNYGGKWLNIYLDPKADDEQLIQFSFITDTFIGEVEAEIYNVTIQNKDEVITNFPEFQSEIVQSNITDSLLKFIIHEENIRTFHTMQELKEVSPKLLKQMEPIFHNADVLMLMRHYNKQTPGIFILDYYNFKEDLTLNSQKIAEKILDQALEKLRPLVFDQTDLKLDLLEKAKSAKDLKFEGETTLEDGHKFKKISFTDPTQNQKLELFIDLDQAAGQVVILPYIKDKKFRLFLPRKNRRSRCEYDSTSEPWVS